LFKLNFEPQYNDFLKAIEEEVLNENIEKISYALDIYKKAGFNVKALNSFSFDKLSFQMFFNTENEVPFKTKLSKYLKKLIANDKNASGENEQAKLVKEEIGKIKF
jgi:nucleoside diphosphate kinase